jgi:hypothetical protein
LRHIDGLCKVVGHVGAQSLHRRIDAGITRQHHDLGATVRNLFDQFKTAPVRQQQVYQEQIRHLLGQQ